MGAGTSFNRYMVECEYDFQKFLICTLAVLIDTWWNVNEAGERVIANKDGFNRYMVECECCHIHISIRF